MAAAELAAVILAAGVGSRLRPLTELRPKPLCPVNNVPLLDLALAELTGLLGPLGPDRVAVNAHHLAEQIVQHVDARAYVSLEMPVALGTAGAIGQLRDWLAGRPVLIRNADAWRPVPPTGSFVDDWDGVRPRLLVVADDQRPDFPGGWRHAGLSLLSWELARNLMAEPSGLFETIWRAALEDGRLDLMPSTDPFVDCGTPANYLAANMHASGGRSVVGAGAVVEGTLEQCVVWPDAVVRRDEHLVGCIRARADVTVCVTEGDD